MHPRLMEKNNNHIFEAEQIGLYLLNCSIQETEKKKYADAMQKLNISFSVYEQLLWNKMLKNKWNMACIIGSSRTKQSCSQKTIYNAGYIRSIPQLYILLSFTKIFYFLFV